MLRWFLFIISLAIGYLLAKEGLSLSHATPIGLALGLVIALFVLFIEININKGSLKSIRHLKKTNNKIDIVLIEKYWKSPLDILRTIIWKHGFENISDETIKEYLNLQNKYLDLIINLDDVDKAHREWSRICQKNIPYKSIKPPKKLDIE